MANGQQPNGGPKIWGVPVTVLQSFIQTTGVATVIVLFLMWLVAQYVPPWLTAQIKLMDRLGESLERIDQSVDSIDEAVNDQQDLLVAISTADYPRSDFREQVDNEHKAMLEALVLQTKLMNSACNGHTNTEDRIKDIHEAVVK